MVIRHSLVRTALLVGTLAAWALPKSSFADDADKLQVPPGFVVTHYADDHLAHDIFSMTIDSLGRVVVSGPGYVRILIDANNDGVAETYKQFADGPATGAQGLFFLGRDLLCTGDAGLIRYRDKDQNDRADGPPDVFLRLKTGSEHNAHSIQKGPDGWWYLVVGNDGRIGRSYANLPSSPLKHPQAGTIMRLKPDLSGGEVIADGMRNAYDFAFNASGDLFVFDSDSEREVSLPWYRPIRVLHTLPGTHAGWVSQSWIRPDTYLDMPKVVASFGRGSPTGVVCYRHSQFPPDYKGALFVLDWTFGRVLAVPLEKDGSTWSSTPHSFMTGKGQFGFAPTDVEVGPDGSLFVSIGGRGTQGSVYRVTYKGDSTSADFDSPKENRKKDEKQSKDPLSLCLAAPQPQSSWSRAKWVPEAKKLGRETLLAAACDPQRAADERVRAIEILTELFDGVDAATLGKLATDKSPAVRARAVWSIGRSLRSTVSADSLKPFVEDTDPSVARAALEATWSNPSVGSSEALLPSIARRLGDADRGVRLAAAHLIGRLDEKQAAPAALKLDESNLTAKLWLAFARCERTTQLNLPSLETAIQVFEKTTSPALRLEALRVMQIALGDCGPGRAKAPMFDGYTSRLDLKSHERELDPIRIRVAPLFPTKNANVDFELARVIAMLTPYNAGLLDRILAEITADSHPVRDIHFLTVAGRIPVERTGEQCQKIAEALVNLEPKISQRGLNQDRNWDDRAGEMYKQLVSLDADLPAAVVANKNFGRPGHVLFLSEISPELLKPAIEAFVKNIRDDRHFKWTTGVVFLLGESADPAHRELIRRRFSEYPLRSAVLMTLAQKPEEADRPKFLEGLDSSQLEVVEACLGALEKLPAQQSPAESFALVKALRRLRNEKPELRLRERAAHLLKRSTQDDFGFVYGEAGHKPQPEVLERCSHWLEKNYPVEFAKMNTMSGENPQQVQDLLAHVAWEQGDVERGHKVFETHNCAQCHSGRTALGPDLAGAARRFSREDLFTAIVQPNRDVSPRYQTTMIETHGGEIYTGMIVYEAVDGLILRNATNQTFRIKPAEIEERRTLKTSLMPNGLLKDLKPDDLADLYAYLRSLSGTPASNVSSNGPSPHLD